jgi:hypothetical protein
LQGDEEGDIESDTGTNQMNSTRIPVSVFLITMICSIKSNVRRDLDCKSNQRKRRDKTRWDQDLWRLHEKGCNERDRRYTKSNLVSFDSHPDQRECLHPKTE